jgi:hypothetical protein
LLLLLAACGYDVPRKEVTLGVGQTETVRIQALHWFSGSMVPVEGSYASSDPTVFALHQAGTGPSMVIQGLRPGVGHIEPVGTTIPLVGVTVLPCLPVTIQPAMAQVLATVGQRVDLRVTTGGAQSAGTVWYEAVGNEWRRIPFALGNTYSFTAARSGAYRFRAEYDDLCGVAMTDITVIVSTRPRAVRH